MGITGGIGSGKSVISRILRCNGFFVYDCDYEAKVIMTENPTVRNSLILILGSDAYFSDGSLNRGYISKALFGSSIIREKVNEVVHKAVYDDFIKKVRSNGINFIESAILKSSQLYEICDEIWLVEAPVKTRIERVSHRNNLSVKEITDRMTAQKEEFIGFGKKDITLIDNKENSPLLLEIKKNISKICMERNIPFMDNSYEYSFIENI